KEYAMVHEGNNNLRFITEERGVRKFNLETKQIATFKGWRNMERWGAYLISGFRDHDGLFWLGDYDNLFRFDPVNEKIVSYTQHINDIQISRLKALQFYETRDGHLWIASNMGLFELDKERKPVRQISEKGKEGY